MQRAICLLSSGLDSSTALAMALDHGDSVELALTFNYGQRAATQEVAAATQIAHHYRIQHRVIALPWMGEFSNALTSRSTNLPQFSRAELSDAAYTANSARACWVPNRNGVFISIGAALAEAMGIRKVIVGFNAEEAATFPDNSTDYVEAMTQSLFYSTANHVELASPTQHFSKAHIVREALRLDVPFRFLWSCYEAGPKMCGRCESCCRLKCALEANQVNHVTFFTN